MGRNTSVSLGNYFEEFVDTKVAQGRYKMQAKSFLQVKDC